MYLTAHHLVSAHDGREGINVFLYLHGPYAWDPATTPTVMQTHPGTLAAQSLSVSPPSGNRVRSYLDIVAPDGAAWSEVRVALMEFIANSQRASFPREGTSGRCFFRLAMDGVLAARWHNELAVLYRSAQALRLQHP